MSVEKNAICDADKIDSDVDGSVEHPKRLSPDTSSSISQNAVCCGSRGHHGHDHHQQQQQQQQQQQPTLSRDCVVEMEHFNGQLIRRDCNDGLCCSRNNCMTDQFARDHETRMMLPMSHHCGHYMTTRSTWDNQSRKRRHVFIRRMIKYLPCNIVTVVVSTVCAVSLVYYVFLPNYFENRNGVQFPEYQRSPCVPCGTGETPTTRRQTVDGHSSLPCCSPVAPHDLRTVIDRLVDEKLAERNGREVTTTSIPVAKKPTCNAAHVVLSDAYPTTDSNSVSEFRSLNGWKNSGDSAYIGQCVQYDNLNGSFRVNQTGHYTIYSHLAFVKDRSSDSSCGQHILVNDTPKLIDIGSATEASRRDKLVYNSVLLATIRLRAGDRLTVIAKSGEDVDRDDDMSYFGFYKLTDVVA